MDKGANHFWDNPIWLELSKGDSEKSPALSEPLLAPHLGLCLCSPESRMLWAPCTVLQRSVTASTLPRPQGECWAHLFLFLGHSETGPTPMTADMREGERRSNYDKRADFPSLLRLLTCHVKKITINHLSNVSPQPHSPSCYCLLGWWKQEQDPTGSGWGVWKAPVLENTEHSLGFSGLWSKHSECTKPWGTFWNSLQLIFGPAGFKKGP